MKILAMSQEVPGTPWESLGNLLKEESRTALQMYYDEVFREIYFTEEGEAVIILECTGKDEARAMLDKLPLVINGYITFQLLELHPYTGFSRLM
jgi:hypothetical protein